MKPVRSARGSGLPGTPSGKRAQEDPAQRAAPADASTPQGDAPPREHAARGRRLSTGEMARLSNNTLRTVRFYEEAGILQPIGRTDGGHRLFAESDLERLNLVTELREAGLSLEEIRSLLELKARAASGMAASDAARTALGDLVAALERKRELLSRLLLDVKATLTATAECRSCDGERHFPDHCGECGKIAPQDDLPRGMRVLWQIEPKAH